MDENEFQNTVLEVIRDFRQEVRISLEKNNDELREFKRDVRGELKALNLGLKGIMNLLEMQQDVSTLQGGRIDELEVGLERLQDRAEDLEDRLKDK